MREGDIRVSRLWTGVYWGESEERKMIGLSREERKGSDAKKGNVRLWVERALL